MKQRDAIEAAKTLVRQHWGRDLELMGARPPSELASGWTVLFRTELPYGPPGAIVDGPTVVVVDEESGVASFFSSL